MTPMILIFLACASTNKPPVEAANPASYWVTEAGWSNSCFRSPDFSALSGETLEKAQRDTLSAMYLQWRGGRNDGVKIDKDLAAEVAGLLRTRLDRVPEIVGPNFDYCETVMSEGAATIAWGNWMATLPETLTEGECLTPFEEDWFHHLELDRSWQGDLPLCAGEAIKITATSNDHYQLSKNGPWLNVTGDGTPPAAGAPCVEEGCVGGMLVGRFDGESGEVWIFPVGTGISWVAPDQGVLSLSVNDSSWDDNSWQVMNQVREQVGIQITSEQ